MPHLPAGTERHRATESKGGRERDIGVEEADTERLSTKCDQLIPRSSFQACDLALVMVAMEKNRLFSWGYPRH
eukprot:scaffold309350_cov21-Tisochrysis_lutea.AAC.1